MELTRPKGAVVNWLLSGREGGSPAQEGNPLQNKLLLVKIGWLPMVDYSAIGARIISVFYGVQEEDFLKVYAVGIQFFGGASPNTQSLRCSQLNRPLNNQ
jgi:hypothetical protein